MENKKPLSLIIGPSFTMALPMLLGCMMSIYGTRASGNSGSAFIYTGFVTVVSSSLIGTMRSLIGRVAESLANAVYGRLIRKCMGWCLGQICLVVLGLL